MRKILSITLNVAVALVCVALAFCARNDAPAGSGSLTWDDSE